jgi:hypothetical protein
VVSSRARSAVAVSAGGGFEFGRRQRHGLDLADRAFEIVGEQSSALRRCA